jgi:AcrR family transcriptional regulator
MLDSDPRDFQRARSQDQIDQRRLAIVQSARKLLVTNGIEEVTLTAIAAESGLVKSNIYRYFESREEILVRILIEESEAMVAALRQNYASLPRRNDMLVCAVIFAHACADRPQFCLLTSALSATLERNISVGRLQEMKLEFSRLMQVAASLLCEAAPDLGKAAAAQAVQLFLQLLAGLWPFAHPKPHVAKAQDHPSLQHFNVDFREHFARACYVILLGIRAG